VVAKVRILLKDAALSIAVAVSMVMAVVTAATEPLVLKRVAAAVALVVILATAA
jgi:hypothetical protein